MQLKQITILLTFALAPTLSQRILSPANDVVTTILQDMLLPKNTGQAVQMMTSAANKMINIPNMPVSVKRRFAITDNPQKTVVRNEAVPKKIIIQRPNDMVARKNVIIQKSNNVILQNGNQVLPNNVVIQRGNDRVFTKQIIVNGNDGIKKNILVRKDSDMPQRVFVKNGNDGSFRISPQRRPNAVVQQKVLINQPKRPEYVAVPQQKVYADSVNPFLPAASPISALAPPTSRDLPPALPQSKGRFLRKIPIPPPSL